MDIESEIYFIDVAGQYDKILSEAPVAGGAAAPADGAAGKVPDEVLRHDYGVTHDHGGEFFFVKSLKAGVIDTKQHEVFGAGAHVVSLKWKLSKGGFCTISTTAAGDGAPPKICPSEPGSTMWFPDKDYSGCVVGVSPDGQYTVTKCESGGNCELSHAASPDDNKPDPMDTVGSTGLQTESTITDVLQEKNTADVILGPAEAHYRLRLRCTLKGDESKVIEQALEIDPNPGADGCDSGTLESMGKCAAPKFTQFVAVPGAAALVAAGFNPSGGGAGAAAADRRRTSSRPRRWPPRSSRTRRRRNGRPRWRWRRLRRTSRRRRRRRRTWTRRRRAARQAGAAGRRGANGAPSTPWWTSTTAWTRRRQSGRWRRSS